MKIDVASHAGFCFGVRNAINKGEKMAKERKLPIATLGPLIHNPQEVKRLERLGIRSYGGFEEMTEPFVLFRTHGVTPEVYQEAERRNLTYFDCTCPKVHHVQNLAKKYAREGYQVLILGDKAHPEVEGIVGWSDNMAVVFFSLDELKSLDLIGKKVCLVAQTTEKKERFEEAKTYLESLLLSELEIFNTICSATRERQDDAFNLAKTKDLMIVVGGSNSANTRKLVGICEDAGAITKHVEEASELDPSWFEGVESIGLTAGASTPDWIIREVLNKMEELTMEQGLEQGYGSLESPNLFDVIKGTVVKIGTDEIMVDIRGKSEGVVPVKELSFQKDPVIEDIVKIGDEIEVMVIKMENSEGHMVLSKKRADQEKAMEVLKEKYEKGEFIEAKVIGAVKGGVIVDIGARGFVPASHLDNKYVDDINAFVGNTYKFQLIEFDPNPEQRKIILSRRAITEAEEREAREALWSEIEEGQTRRGKVQRIATFGAFIDLGGVDGLLHISEMGWNRVKQPTDVVKVGDEIEVYVLSADKDKNKISLSLKQLLTNPWDEVAERYAQGSVHTGKVARLAPFGAFINLEEGVDGLVHISQIAWEHVEKVEDALKVGDEVEVKVLDVDKENKRISLSIKELKERPVVEKPAPKPKKEARPKAEAPSVQEEISTNLGDVIGDLLEK